MSHPLLYSIAWEIEPGEDVPSYRARLNLQSLQYKQLHDTRGCHYILTIKGGEVITKWEDEINIEDLKQLVNPSAPREIHCPICQPHDHRDVGDDHTQRRYFCRIVNPKYPNGFIDKGGVLANCPCTSKGREREQLKFMKGRMK